jgi:hypothetical protein
LTGMSRSLRYSGVTTSDRSQGKTEREISETELFEQDKSDGSFGEQVGRESEGGAPGMQSGASRLSSEHPCDAELRTRHLSRRKNTLWSEVCT